MQAPVIPATWEAEANHLNPGGGGCSEPRDRATALQPGQQSQTLSQNKRKQNEQRKGNIYHPFISKGKNTKAK